MSQPTCETCRFSYGSPLRQCRRFPPSRLTTDSSFRWPSVNKDEWCGEYKPKSRVTENHT
jgi:hypothetical protein